MKVHQNATVSRKQKNKAIFTGKRAHFDAVKKMKIRRPVGSTLDSGDTGVKIDGVRQTLV